MWNTGCNVVYNRTAKRFFWITDGEAPNRMLPVSPQDEAAFGGLVVPWADNDSEVTTKAFRVQYVSPTTGKQKGWFYIYQDYKTDLVCWVDWTSTSPYEDGAANSAAFKASYIDIQIDASDEGDPVVEFVKVW